MSKDCRQHYQLATGEALASAPSTAGQPGFAKGGPVKGKGISGFKRGAQNSSGMVRGHKKPFAGKSS